MEKSFGQPVHILPLSLSDYPGKLSAVVFFAGCNLRCPFCYNAELVLPELSLGLGPRETAAVLSWLKERAGFLDGVVLTGGEPTLSPHLLELAEGLKELGFLVKLDTNGTEPEILARLLATDLLDYVALDLKAPFSRYGEYVGRPDSAKVVESVRQSIALIMDRAKDYEFRTTVAPGLGPNDLRKIAEEVAGAKRYVLQPFLAPKEKRLVDESWRGRAALAAEELKALIPELRKILPAQVRA